MTQDTEPNYDAIEAQIIDLFGQLPQSQRASLIDVLIGFVQAAEEDEFELSYNDL